jgi:hypothetical protein
MRTAESRRKISNLPVLGTITDVSGVVQSVRSTW